MSLVSASRRTRRSYTLSTAESPTAGHPTPDANIFEKTAASKCISDQRCWLIRHVNTSFPTWCRSDRRAYHSGSCQRVPTESWMRQPMIVRVMDDANEVEKKQQEAQAHRRELAIQEETKPRRSTVRAIVEPVALALGMQHRFGGQVWEHPPYLAGYRTPSQT
jgi:hypothetical protein